MRTFNGCDFFVRQKLKIGHNNNKTTQHKQFERRKKTLSNEQTNKNKKKNKPTATTMSKWTNVNFCNVYFIFVSFAFHIGSRLHWRSSALYRSSARVLVYSHIHTNIHFQLELADFVFCLSQYSFPICHSNRWNCLYHSSFFFLQYNGFNS